MTWEENSPPILAFYNAETPLGQSTASLIELYNDILNEEVDQVKLEESTWVPEHDLSVEEVMAEAAAQYFELAEEAESGGHHESHFMPKSGHGEGEAFGAYYFYELDESTNTYSIGVYGNQVAAASCPTFGATMLQTLAQKISGKSELKIEFNNKLLPVNNALFPMAEPLVAEVYGVSTIAAVTFVVAIQVALHGKPINSGFYDAFKAMGGTKTSYQFTKYLMMILLNFLMCCVIYLFLMAQ